MSKLIISSLLIGSLFPICAADHKAAAKIRVNVNMALVPVSVTDNYGRNVTGLARENFRVIDGTRPVPIVSFGYQDQPITVGLIFDCSGSMVEKYKTARQAPRELFQQLNPEDQSFLVTVSDKAELRHALTNDFGELGEALLFVQPKGATSLIDGVYMGLEHMRKAHTPHKALVLVSDGGDNNSRYTLRELESLAVESDTQIFAAGLFENPQTTEEVQGPSLLAQLCGRTGGLSYMTRNISELHTVMGKIGVTLHNQYLLGYYPADGGEATAGKFRKITVQLLLPRKLPLQIHARSGYYLPQ